MVKFIAFMWILFSCCVFGIAGWLANSNNPTWGWFLLAGIIVILSFRYHETSSEKPNNNNQDG